MFIAYIILRILEENKMNTETVNQELLNTLKLVKQVMDSTDYSLSFDDLYDKVTEVIEKCDIHTISL